MSRPLLPPDDPAVARRRMQYRMSKRRSYERGRHERGICKSPCILTAKIEEPIPRVWVPLKNGEGFVWLPA